MEQSQSILRSGDAQMVKKFSVFLCNPNSLPLIALMKEAASTSETSVNFYHPTRRNNPDNHFHIECNVCLFVTKYSF
jgi:hypothetical protein